MFARDDFLDRIDVEYVAELPVVLQFIHALSQASAFHEAVPEVVADLVDRGAGGGFVAFREAEQFVEKNAFFRP